jgi:hypothetical protein
VSVFLLVARTDYQPNVFFAHFASVLHVKLKVSSTGRVFDGEQSGDLSWRNGS